MIFLIRCFCLSLKKIRVICQLLSILCIVIYVIIWMSKVDLNSSNNGNISHVEVYNNFEPLSEKHYDVLRRKRILEKPPDQKSEGSRLNNIKEVCRKYSLGKYTPTTTSTSRSVPVVSSTKRVVNVNKDSKSLVYFRESPTAAIRSVDVVDYSKWILETRHQLALNPIYGTGTSFWLSIFQYLRKFKRKKNSPYTEKLMSLKNKKEEVQSSFKFVSVTHPFYRLAWTYLDNVMENATTTPFDKTIESYLETTKKENRSFKTFLMHIVSTPVKQYGALLQPYHKQVLPCDINYHYITKTETLYEDAKYILGNLYFINTIWTSEVEYRIFNAVRNSSTAARYLSEIDTALLLKVYDIYELDFELFGYDTVFEYTP